MVDLECDGAEPLFAAMMAIDAPLGAYMVIGNHDLLDDAPQVRVMATEAGVRVLDDEVVHIPRSAARLPHVGIDAHGLAGDHPLVIAGIDWDKSVTGLATRIDRIANENPLLLLAHNPKAFLPAARSGIPLILSGHTHGGQIASKKRPGVNLAVAHRHSAGFYHRDVSTLFVTVGTGSWFPLRVQCPAEVVVITCRAAEMGVRELDS
jgi:predicted MPP superfamily phosphohydrolase